MDMRKVGPIPLDPKVTTRLLDLLSTDDKFRQLFESDTAAALAQVGYKVEAGATPISCLYFKAGDRLASKAKIVRDRAKLEKALNSVVKFSIVKDFQAD